MTRSGGASRAAGAAGTAGAGHAVSAGDVEAGRRTNSKCCKLLIGRLLRMRDHQVISNDSHSLTLFIYRDASS